MNNKMGKGGRGTSCGDVLMEDSTFNWWNFM